MYSVPVYPYSSGLDLDVVKAACVQFLSKTSGFHVDGLDLFLGGNGKL